MLCIRGLFWEVNPRWQPPRGGGAAAEAPPDTYREVTELDGTFEEAVAMGIIDKPPPMLWGDWQTWRTLSET